MNLAFPRAQRQRRTFVGLAGVALLCVATGTIAQDWPSRAVRIVVPYPAGGAVDIVSRALAEKLATALNQPFIIDN